MGIYDEGNHEDTKARRAEIIMNYILNDKEIKMLEFCVDILNKVWRDLLEWGQLATNTRNWHKEEGRDPNRQPFCPSELGINKTDILRNKLTKEVIGPIQTLNTNIEIYNSDTVNED